jgi:hypothetical protein
MYCFGESEEERELTRCEVCVSLDTVGELFPCEE